MRGGGGLYNIALNTDEIRYKKSVKAMITSGV